MARSRTASRREASWAANARSAPAGFVAAADGWRRRRPDRSDGSVAPGAGQIALRTSTRGRARPPGRGRRARRRARRSPPRACAGKVDLVYVDPPFASQAEYVHEARLDGPADGRVVRHAAYDDRWERDGSATTSTCSRRGSRPRRGCSRHRDALGARRLARLVPRAGAARRDPRARRVHQRDRVAPRAQPGAAGGEPPVRPDARHARRLRRRRTREARAARRASSRSSRRRSASTRTGAPFTTAPRGDYTDESIARLEGEGRVHRTASGKVYVKYFLVKDADGRWCRERRVDALWTDVAPLRHARPASAPAFRRRSRARCSTASSRARRRRGARGRPLRAGAGRRARARTRSGAASSWATRRRSRIATARARLLAGRGAPSSVESCGPPRPIEPQPPVEPVVRASTRRGDRVAWSCVAPREPLAWAVDAAPDRVAPVPRRVALGADARARASSRSCARRSSIERAGPTRRARLVRRRRASARAHRRRPAS